MIKFAAHFCLSLEQPELDFVNIPLDADLEVYVDPFAIPLYDDAFSRQCNDVIVGFFQSAISAISSGNTARAERMLQHLSEPNETRLGLSSGKPQGRGIGHKQALDLYTSIAASKAAKSGLVSELSECDLFIDGIGSDKISDITTNILRSYLIAYTQAQCRLHDIRLSPSVPSGFIWDDERAIWGEHYVPLPTYNGSRVLLVPKHFVRHRLAINSQDYLNKHVLEFLQVEHLNAATGLVEVLRNGNRRVTKKSLKETYPCTKEWMAAFTVEHPEVLERYKAIVLRVAKLERKIEADYLNEGFVETVFAQALIERLMEIPPGNESATTFHNLQKGIMEFLFWPNMINPEKEREIHEGRKRIDILYTNAAQSGFFYRMLYAPQIAAIKIPVECKNYSKDPENPEVDQLAGRFAPNRGWLGFLVYRTTSDYDLLIRRCRDTAIEKRGFMIPLGDREIIEMLEFVAEEKRQRIDDKLQQILNRLVY